ncbi:MAG: peptide deformylase [Rickettsiales bacterium]|jgi:peptide deformylase|nr:peptide deformylase [Rickettsiales bacterium]
MKEELKLRLVGDNVLREKAMPVALVGDNIRDVLSRMEKIMRDNKGAGLAAPQVGLLLRMVIFADIDQKDAPVYKLVNPKIVRQSSTLRKMEEGCLSVLGPDGPVFAEVLRPESVELEWTDENGDARSGAFSGYAARAVLHELDHLDGVLFLDYLTPVKREMVMRKVKKRR